MTEDEILAISREKRKKRREGCVSVCLWSFSYHIMTFGCFRVCVFVVGLSAGRKQFGLFQGFV